ncbi:MAG: vanomycin resistance protein VanB [Peptococcaceae bacterium]|nr:MAG: vanomycin resistance protein VanB [Peptococcaceae bacterium]
MSAKYYRLIPGFLLVVVILSLGIYKSGLFAFAAGRVIPNVRVQDVDLQGLSKDEGIQKLADLEKRLQATRVLLKYGDKRWSMTVDGVSLSIDKEAVMANALRVGRQGSLFHRWQERRMSGKYGLEVPLVIIFDQEKLAQKVKELAGEILVEPQNPVLKISSKETVTVVPGSNGIGVDFKRLNNDLTTIFVENKFPEVELSLIDLPPAHSTDFVQSMNINGLLASYSTRFDPSKVNRVYNIKVAAHAFNDFLVPPGEVVSFNQVVGPRSSEAGYKNAPVIVNNELVDGLGGGVCQVSTTLYNSVLLANLEVVERDNHSLPVGYVPVGRDATVVYGAIDFKFRNNTGGYLYLKSFVSGNQLAFKIYGNTADKRNVTIRSWVTKEIGPNVVYEKDPNLYQDEQVVRQKGSKGYAAAAERIVINKGVVEKKEPLPASYYSPVNKIVAVGVMERPVPLVAPAVPAPAVPPQPKPVPGSDAGGTGSDSGGSPEQTNRPGYEQEPGKGITISGSGTTAGETGTATGAVY